MLLMALRGADRSWPRRTGGLACSGRGRLARFGGEDRDGLGFARPGVVAFERVDREAHADGFVIFVAASEEMRLALFRRPRRRGGVGARDARSRSASTKRAWASASRASTSARSRRAAVGRPPRVIVAFISLMEGICIDQQAPITNSSCAIFHEVGTDCSPSLYPSDLDRLSLTSPAKTSRRNPCKKTQTH